MQIVADSIAKLKSQTKAPLVKARSFGMPMNVKQKVEQYISSTLQSPVAQDRRGKGSYPVAQTQDGRVVYSDGSSNTPTPEQVSYNTKNNPLAKVLADIPNKLTLVYPASGQWNTYRPDSQQVNPLGANAVALGQEKIPIEAKAVRDFALVLKKPTQQLKTEVAQNYLERLKEKIDNFLTQYPIEEKGTAEQTTQPVNILKAPGIPTVQSKNVVARQVASQKQRTLIPVTSVSANSVGDPVEQYRGLIAKITGGMI